MIYSLTLILFHYYFTVDPSGIPVIYNVSASDQTLNIYSGHETVVLICRVIGENISGGYWEKVDGTLSANHNKSKLISHDNHHKATVKMTITKVKPVHSGRYRCVIFTPWSVVKSDGIQVIVRSKGRYILCSWNLMRE